jgi:hypothetical protein
MSTIDLNDNKLTGSISNDICNLGKLNFLQLGNEQNVGNSFLGATIPNCIGLLQNLGKCRAIFLCYCLRFSIQPCSKSVCLANFPSSALAVFDVKNLGLVGSLPKLPTDLVFLDVANNTLNGDLSATPWDKLKNLGYLAVTNNTMAGTIPSSIGAIPNLKFASFYNNNFTGSMPQQICDRTQTTLKNLEADCLGNPPQLSCTCCTFCAV